MSSSHKAYSTQRAVCKAAVSHTALRNEVCMAHGQSLLEHKKCGLCCERAVSHKTQKVQAV